MALHVQVVETASLLPVTAPPRPPATSLIMMFAFVDQLTFYGVTQGLKNLMQVRMGFSQVIASCVLNTFWSVSDVAPVLGAFLGDQVLGPYQTILYLGAWYVGASAVLCVSVVPSMVAAHPSISSALFLAAIFGGIAFGNGCFDSNLATFGADQFDGQSNDLRKQRFFSRFYLVRNAGCLLAYSCLAYTSVDGLGAVVPRADGYLATFAFCTVLMVVAVSLFATRSSSYKKRLPTPGAFTSLFATLAGSVLHCSHLRVVAIGFALFGSSFVWNAIAMSLEVNSTGSMCMAGLGAASIVAGALCWIVQGADPGAYIQMHPTLAASEKADLTQIVRLLPFASFYIVWMIVFGQLTANFQSIVQQCDLRLGREPDAPQLPGSTVNVFEPCGVLLGLVVLDHVVYPGVAWLRRGKQASPFERVLAGYVLCAAAMVWTGQVEMWRRASGPIDAGGAPVDDLGGGEPMSRLSWVYMVPSYVVVSFAECLIQVTAMEVFYTHVPPQLKSTAQAMLGVMAAIGDNAVSILTLLFASVLPDDLNEGRVEVLYFALAGLVVVNIAGYVVVMQRMQFATQHPVNSK